MQCPRCRLDNLEGTLVCTRCDFPLTDLLSTKKLDATSADILALPAVGETKLLDRMKLRLVIAEKHKIDVEIHEQLVLGRATAGQEGKPDVDLTPWVGQDNVLGVSRYHVMIKRVGMNIVVNDNSSTNGTWLNGERLTDNDPHFIHDGDVLFLGHLAVQVFFIR